MFDLKKCCKITEIYVFIYCNLLFKKSICLSITLKIKMYSTDFTSNVNQTETSTVQLTSTAAIVVEQELIGNRKMA